MKTDDLPIFHNFLKGLEIVGMAEGEPLMPGTNPFHMAWIAPPGRPVPSGESVECGVQHQYRSRTCGVNCPNLAKRGWFEGAGGFERDGCHN